MRKEKEKKFDFCVKTNKKKRTWEPSQKQFLVYVNLCCCGGGGSSSEPKWSTQIIDLPTGERERRRPKLIIKRQSIGYTSRVCAVCRQASWPSIFSFFRSVGTSPAIRRFKKKWIKESITFIRGLTFGTDCVTLRVFTRSLLAGRRSSCRSRCFESARAGNQWFGHAQHFEYLAEGNLTQGLLGRRRHVFAFLRTQIAADIDRVLLARIADARTPSVVGAQQNSGRERLEYSAEYIARRQRSAGTESGPFHNQLHCL